MTRIISLVPSQTELLVDLGLEKNIVGITKFCVHPSSLKKNKTIVGGTKIINIEKIKALKPDIILCNKEENTKEIVTLCLNVAPTHVSDIYTIKDATELITHYGIIFDRSKRASEINHELNNKISTFLQFIKRAQSHKVTYFIWKKPWMVAANHTFINQILTINKYQNIYSDLERYPEIKLEEAIKKEVDIIFLSSEPYPFKEKHIKELQEVFPKTKILLVDGEMFSWYGSRLLKAFDYFKSLRQKI